MITSAVTPEGGEEHADSPTGNADSRPPWQGATHSRSLF